MSRIGKQPIPIPDGIQVKIDGDALVAKGPLGSLTQPLLRETPVAIEDGEIRVSRINDTVPVRAKHGLMRALLANAVTGVKEGFTKELEIVGVGYRAEVKGKEIHFALGYSHPIEFPIPEGVDVEIDRNNKITIKGRDRQQVGQMAAEIRSLRPPDPYKGKGIRYSGETIRRKVGKAGSK